MQRIPHLLRASKKTTGMPQFDAKRRSADAILRNMFWTGLCSPAPQQAMTSARDLLNEWLAWLDDMDGTLALLDEQAAEA